ncbi:hypothetical protein Hanom_Chr01g00001061 [Helianthus anomalus]
MHFVTHLVTKHWGLNVLQSTNDRDHPCTFGKSWGLNTLQSATTGTFRVLLKKQGRNPKFWLTIGIFRVLLKNQGRNPKFWLPTGTIRVLYSLITSRSNRKSDS